MRTGEPIEETQAADMARLSAIAADGDPQAIEAARAPSIAGELAHLITAFVVMAGPIFPTLKTVYTEEATTAAAEAVSALCEKYEWAPGGLLSEWGVEIGAAVVLLPLGFATVKAVRHDLAEHARRDEYIKLKKQADLVQHMNLAHNLDGQTVQTRSPFGAFGAVEQQDSAQAGGDSANE